MIKVFSAPGKYAFVDSSLSIYEFCEYVALANYMAIVSKFLLFMHSLYALQYDTLQYANYSDFKKCVDPKHGF